MRTSWDRSNPYEGPNLCACGHDYGEHAADDLMECMTRRCECAGFDCKGEIDIDEGDW